MQYTTHYNLNLPEGTDVVNPLVQDNPNYTAIDAAMFANKQAVIGTASEVASGTAHAITRSNADSNYFRYTATSNWTAGDTMTVDGTVVSVYLSDGTTPLTGAYVINSEVLAILNGSRVTLIISRSGAPANAISYDNTVSGLAAVNVQDAIDELEAAVDKGKESVSADGVKTYETLFTELATALDWSKLSINSHMKIGSLVLSLSYTSAGTAAYARVGIGTNIEAISITIRSNGVHEYKTLTNGTVSNIISTVPANGTAITIYY